CGSKRQTAGDAQLRAESLPTAAWTAVMNRAERHVCFAPAILKIVQRGWNPGIGKGEVLFRLEIECGLVRMKMDAVVLGGDRWIDLCMVNRVLLKFCRRPGEHE